MQRLSRAEVTDNRRQNFPRLVTAKKAAMSVQPNWAIMNSRGSAQLDPKTPKAGNFSADQRVTLHQYNRQECWWPKASITAAPVRVRINCAKRLTPLDTRTTRRDAIACWRYVASAVIVVKSTFCCARLL